MQWHDRQAVVANPPAFPLSEQEMDRIYDLPYTRRPHPSYSEPVPAFEMIKDSVTIMRGCFGGCTFCSITAHQVRIIQSRSHESIVREAERLGRDPQFAGVISDIGGPTANMYQMRCTRPEMDLAQKSPEYLEELARHHVGGRLKVAPEHTDPRVLALMKKPSIANFGVFAREFGKASERAGKPKQFLVPYFIASHPGSDLDSMIHLAVYLKRNGYRPDQVQDFIPAPFDIATCMYYTGIDPMTKKPVRVATKLRDRKMQRALMQFFKPENYFEVREALIQAKRTDLIGDGCDCLIPAQPPKGAIEARRKRANDGDHYHTVANPARGEKPGERGAGPPKPTGYRPGRKSANRRHERKKGGGRKQ